MQKEYFAGLFDGEGCVRIYKNKDSKSKFEYRYGLLATICMTGKEALVIAQKKWNGGLYCEDRTDEGYLPIWRWKVHCDEAEKFLRDIYPYVYEKKKQIKLALEFQKKCMRRKTAKGGYKTLTKKEHEMRNYYYKTISHAKHTNRGGVLQND